MYLLFWLAAGWLIASVGVTLAFFAAKRSQYIYAWLFGERPAADVHRLTPSGSRNDGEARLAA